MLKPTCPFCKSSTFNIFAGGNDVPNVRKYVPALLGEKIEYCGIYDFNVKIKSFKGFSQITNLNAICDCFSYEFIYRAHDNYNVLCEFLRLQFNNEPILLANYTMMDSTIWFEHHSTIDFGDFCFDFHSPNLNEEIAALIVLS